MPLGEGVELRALQIEHADAAILQEQRNHQLRSRIVHDLDVARIGRDVGDVDRLLVQRRVADETDAELDARQRHFVAVADGDFHLELAGLLVHEEDAERPVVDDAPREVGDPREQLVEVEDRAELAGDLRQRLERAGVVALVLDEQRVLDRDRDVRAELAQHRFVDLGELADRVRQQVERADDAPLAAHRDDELRVRAGHRFDVARVAVHVVDEDRLPLGDGGADHPLAHFQPERARDVFRIADRVRDGQLVALRIEQVHREGLELREARDQLRDLLQQLVEIEHRRDLAAEREERRELFGRGGLWSRCARRVAHWLRSIIVSSRWT